MTQEKPLYLSSIILKTDQDVCHCSLLRVSQCVPCLTRLASMRPAIISCAPVSPAIKDCWSSHGLGFGFCTYLSNNCVNQELVLKTKSIVRVRVWALFNWTRFLLTTQYGYSLKPSGLLFRDPSIFPLTKHSCLRRIQATKNIIPSICVGHTGFVWQIRSLETQTRALHIYSSLADFPFFPSRLYLSLEDFLYQQLIFRFMRKKGQIFVLGVVILRVLT